MSKPKNTVFLEIRSIAKLVKTIDSLSIKGFVEKLDPKDYILSK